MSFSSRDNVELAIDKIQTKLANKSDWKQRYKALEELENLVQTGFNEEGEVFVSIFMDALMHSELRRIFPSSFVDLRSEILRQASSTLSVMAECLKGKMTGLLDLLTNNLILACSKVNKVIRRYAIPAMHDVIENVPSKRMLKPLILSIQQTKSKQMRPIFTQFLQAALENWPTRTLSSKSVEIENCIKFAIECPTGQTRDAAARCYFLYVKHFPKKSKHFLGRLPSRGKQLIERMQGQDTPVPKHASPAKERKSGRPGTPKRISRISSSLSSRPSSRPSSAAGLSRRSSSRNGPKRPTSSQKSTRAGGTGRRRPGSRSGGKNRSTPPPSESRRPATATTASMRGGSNLSRKTTIAVTKAFTPKRAPAALTRGLTQPLRRASAGDAANVGLHLSPQHAKMFTLSLPSGPHSGYRLDGKTNASNGVTKAQSGGADSPDWHGQFSKHTTPPRRLGVTTSVPHSAPQRRSSRSSAEHRTNSPPLFTFDPASIGPNRHAPPRRFDNTVGSAAASGDGIPRPPWRSRGALQSSTHGSLERKGQLKQSRLPVHVWDPVAGGEVMRIEKKSSRTLPLPDRRRNGVETGIGGGDVRVQPPRTRIKENTTSVSSFGDGITTPPRPKKSTSQTPQFLSTGHIPRPTFMSKSQGSSPMDTSSPIRQKRHSYHASTDNPLMASTYTADRSRGSSMPDNPLARQSLSARFTREASPSRRRGLSADTGAHSRDSSPELFTETRSRHSLGRASGKDLNETSIPNIGTIVGLQSDDSTHDSGSGDGKMQSRAEMEEDPQGGVAKSVMDTVTSVTSEPVKSRSRRKSHRRNISLTPLVPAAADAILAALQGSNKGVNRSDNGDSKGLGVSTCDNGVSAAVSIAETEVGVVPSSSIQDLLSATATQPPELERSLSDTPLVDTCGSSGPMSPPARRKVQGQGSRPLPKQSFALDADSIATIMKTKEISQGGTRSSSKLRRPSNVVISRVNAVAESPQPQSTQASDTFTADKRMKEKIPRPPSAGNGGGRGSKVTQGLPTYMLVIKRYQKQVMGLWNQYNRDEIAAETFSSKVVEVLGQQLSRTSSLIEKLKDAAKSTQKPRADARDSELKQPGSLLKQLSGSDITES